MNKTTNEYNNFKTTVYFEHIAKQLYKNMFSNAHFDIIISKSFDREMNLKLSDFIDGDNIYLQSVSALAEKNLDYYLKNLEISINEIGYDSVNIKYDYYKKSENISNTNIKVVKF
jgi:hypothetical protein